MSTKIADIRDPNLFQRLVRALFAASQGHSFQVVDDSSGDRGNDGYDAEAGILLAIYCPEKGIKAQRALDKGRDDLKKAIKLVADPAYSFSKWFFVTPEPLPEHAQATLRAEALSAGLSATFISAENLEPLFLAHPHLHDLFPELTYPRVQAALDEVSAKLSRLEKHLTPDSQPSPETVSPPAEPLPSDTPTDPLYSTTLFGGFHSDELARIPEALAAGDKAARYQLERYRLQARSVRDRLAALMIECEYEQDQLNLAELERLAQEGWNLGRASAATAEAAVFGARLGLARTMKLASREIDFSARLGMMAITGAPLVSMEEAKSHDREVPQIKDAINELFREAYSLARDSRNLLSLFTVTLLYAHSKTQSIFPLRIPGRERITPNIPQLVDQAAATVHSAYDVAISIATALNSKRLTAMAFSNYANDIRTFGEEARALEHAKYALQLAKEIDDREQLAKSEMLVQRLTGTAGDSAEHGADRASQEPLT